VWKKHLNAVDIQLPLHIFTMPTSADATAVEVSFNKASASFAKAQDLVSLWLSGAGARYPGTTKTDEELEKEENGIFMLEPELYVVFNFSSLYIEPLCRLSSFDVVRPVFFEVFTISFTAFPFDWRLHVRCLRLCSLGACFV